MKKNLYTLFFALAVVAFCSNTYAQVTVTYQVDMTGAMLGAAGGTCPVLPFDASTDVVQAMGAEYNGWSEAENVACGTAFTADASIDFAPVSAGSMIYTRTKDVTPDALGKLTWKYRINHSWDNDELRGVGDGNRHASIPTGAAAVTIVSLFNDTTNTVTINSGVQNPKLAEVRAVYPNPASGNAVISYYTLSNDNVSVYLTNMLGQSVKTFFNGNQYVGLHNETMDLTNLSTGIYFVNVRVGNSVASQKISILD
ncbi:MAG: T9SS type A sorting domain-containing protein [Chitinophagaceae bacterium]|nr:T9SS type A sorting domain-containing protein [Chitinophagaceae bacterium]